MHNAYVKSGAVSGRNPSNTAPSAQKVLKPYQLYPSSTQTQPISIAANQLTLKGDSQLTGTTKSKSQVLTDRVIRMRDVIELTGLCRSSIYLRTNGSNDNKYYDPTFPRKFSLSGNGKRGAVGYLLSEVLCWIEKQANSRHQGDAK
ncbi:AlpA family phage regulatory protein [Propionivibrio dicarboxylicus]|uniref:helix-turn-helix transcriptional regulator n=1 Tax=Propionivibrio dicarboxylicus TaxID=83767 RepID=UPI00115F84C9